ncbi:MAG: hypothetical protein ACE5GB_11845 [Acidimicrobiales bacterium]
MGAEVVLIGLVLAAAIENDGSMRGTRGRQLSLLSTEDLIPADHPIRRIREVVDEVLAELADRTTAGTDSTSATSKNTIQAASMMIGSPRRRIMTPTPESSPSSASLQDRKSLPVSAAQAPPSVTTCPAANAAKLLGRGVAGQRRGLGATCRSPDDGSLQRLR